MKTKKMHSQKNLMKNFMIKNKFWNKWDLFAEVELDLFPLEQQICNDFTQKWMILQY